MYLDESVGDGYFCYLQKFCSQFIFFPLQDETFIEFEKGNLFWMEKGLKYGDYSAGPDKVFSKVEKKTSECIFLSVAYLNIF